MLAVLVPLWVTLTNWTEGVLQFEGPWHAQNEALGSRTLSFSGTLYIEQSDFSLAPPKKWKRLARGEMVRVRYGLIIRLYEVVMDGDQVAA